MLNVQFQFLSSQHGADALLQEETDKTEPGNSLSVSLKRIDGCNVQTACVEVELKAVSTVGGGVSTSVNGFF